MEKKAIYEDEGYCPNEKLDFKIQYNPNLSEKSKMATEILGERKEYVVYIGAEFSYGECYFVQVMANDRDSTLGIEVATILKVVFPYCRYPEATMKLVCHDVINPYQIPDLELEVNTEEWKVENGIFIEDEQFLCVIKKTGEKQMDLYFYKK